MSNFFVNVPLSALLFRPCILFCITLSIAIYPLPVRAFDAAAFWQEPNVPFDITNIQNGHESNNAAGGRWNDSNRRAARQNATVEWRSFIFTSEIYQGAPMRIYAIYARPTSPGPHPAIVSLHGGIDRAQLARALAFAHAGYACIAFDWLPPNAKNLSGPAPSRTVYAKLNYEDWGQMFSDIGPDGKAPVIYRAIIAARRALTWLSQQKEVDATRLGVEGHSWGGYLVQLLAGVEPRLKAVVSSAAAGSWQRRYNESTRRPAPKGTLPPLVETSIADGGVADVYFTGERDAIVDGHRFGDLSPKEMTAWAQRYDPATFAVQIRAPILVRLGASDFFASPDGLADYWPKIREPKALQLFPAGNHAFGDVETRVLWFGYWFKQAPQEEDTPKPAISNWKLIPGANGSWTVSVPLDNAVTGQVAWTTTPGPSVVRQWAQRPLGKIKGPNGESWTATFTPQQGAGALRVFVSLKNAAGFVWSTLPQVHEPKVREAKTKGALPSSAQAVKEGALSVAHTTVSPLDNTLMWNKARELGPIALSPEMTSERSANLQALWDENALYLRAQIADSTPWQTVRDPSTWWNSDSLHLRLATGDKQTSQVVHLVAFNNGTTPGLVAFHDPNLRRPDTDLRPIKAHVEVGKNSYSLQLRLPWRWIDSQFLPRSGQKFRLAFLVNDGDLLVNEAILGANWGNAHALYKPEVWSVAQLNEGSR